MGGDEAPVKMVGVESVVISKGTTAVGSAEATTKEVTLKELARRMASFAAAREWDQFHSPRNLLLALVLIIVDSPFPKLPKLTSLQSSILLLLS